MVRLIMGVKGSGKTKQLIELINAAAKDEAGNVVCIEPKRDMSYNIHYNIRLIDAQEYDLHSYEVFRGFISGLYAGNYDISQVFIDNLCKTVGTDVDAETEKFLNWLDVFGERNNIKSIECVEYPELGMEAIWKIEVENFPAFILVDDKGNDFFKQLKPWNCKK